MQGMWQRDEDWRAKWDQTVIERKSAQEKVDKGDLTQRIKSEKEEKGCFLRVGGGSQKKRTRKGSDIKDTNSGRKKRKQSKAIDGTSLAPNGVSLSFTCDLAAVGRRYGGRGKNSRKLGKNCVP